MRFRMRIRLDFRRRVGLSGRPVGSAASSGELEARGINSHFDTLSRARREARRRHTLPLARNEDLSRSRTLATLSPLGESLASRLRPGLFGSRSNPNDNRAVHSRWIVRVTSDFIAVYIARQLPLRRGNNVRVVYELHLFAMNPVDVNPVC